MVRWVSVGVIDNKAGSAAGTEGKRAGGGNWSGSNSKCISLDGSAGEISVTGGDVDGGAGELASGERRPNRHRQRACDIKLEKVVAHEIGVTIYGIDDRGIHPFVVRIGVTRRQSGVADTLERAGFGKEREDKSESAGEQEF